MNISGNYVIFREEILRECVPLRTHHEGVQNGGGEAGDKSEYADAPLVNLSVRRSAISFFEASLLLF
jgi:hypothetical protein